MENTHYTLSNTSSHGNEHHESFRRPAATVIIGLVQVTFLTFVVIKQIATDS